MNAHDREKIEAIGYSRVSSKEQEEEGFSLLAQRQLLYDYAKANGITIIKIFEDVETAKVEGRKEFNKMVEYLKSSKTCHTILVEKVDRLFRNLSDAGLILERLKVNVHFVKEREIITPESRSSEKLICGIKVLFAKNTVDNLSEETIKGMMQKAKEGMWPSQAPVGYLNVEGPNRKRIIIPDPERAPIIKSMFEWYASGKFSMNDIAEKVNAEGFTYPRGGKIYRSQVEIILSKLIYSGDFMWNGVLYKGVYEGIVSKELFQKVQEIKKSRIAGRPSNLQKHFFAFQGMVTCGKCGCAMVAEIHKGKYIYYHCTKSRGKCETEWIREEVLDLHFRESINAIRLDPDVVEWMVEVMGEKFADEKRYHEERISTLCRQRQMLEGRLEKIYLDKLDGVISSEEFAKFGDKFRSEIMELEAAIEGHKAPNQHYLEDAGRLLELAQKAASLYSTQNMEEKRKLLKFTHSNSSWADGKLIPNYRKPFDLLAVTNQAYQEKKVTSRRKSDLLKIWLPNPDSNQGHGD